jgi:hypothetical protein
LDIDSVGHGIETVTVTNVGTQSVKAQLLANANAGATNIIVRSRGGMSGLVVGDKMTIGTPANQGQAKAAAVSLRPPEGVVDSAFLPPHPIEVRAVSRTASTPTATAPTSCSRPPQTWRPVYSSPVPALLSLLH